MGTLYMIDQHNVTLGSSKINDTLSVPAGTVYTGTRSTRGSFVVNVPYEIPLDGVPGDLDDLITKKYAGILALYPGFTHILFDEQTDATGWSFPPSTGVPLCTVGERQSTSLSLGGTLESTVTVLASAPTTAIVRWEAYQYIYASDPNATGNRTYNEQDPAGFAVSVSFNNGSTYNAVTNGLVLSIPLASQGNQFKVRFQRNSGPLKLGLAAWTLIY
jgi:hypothetical protein